MATLAVIVLQLIANRHLGQSVTYLVVYCVFYGEMQRHHTLFFNFLLFVHPYLGLY